MIARNLLGFSSTRPLAKICDCWIAVGWNRRLARILPDAHPKRVERGAAAVKAHKYFVERIKECCTNNHLMDEGVIKRVVRFSSATREQAISDISEQVGYFMSCNQRLHVQICDEVMDFLATKSGGYCMERILLSVLPMPINSGELTLERILSDPPLILMAGMVAATVSGTHWGEIIPRWTGIEKNIFKEG